MNRLRVLCFVAICVLSRSIVFSQTSFEYVPVKDDPLRLQTIQKEIRRQYEKDSLAITGENKKYILEVYRDRFTGLNELFDKKEPVTETDAAAYLQRIADEIIGKNPELKSLSPRIFFSRAWWPNAYSTGEGTIVFNIDLFIKLQNESQVAFVLCHELSHLYLNHSNKKINRVITALYSEETQRELKRLKKQEYDKNSELAKLEKGIVFKTFRHSREFESEADSMGLKFMKNTGYDCKESLTCLAMLDEIDEEKTDYSLLLPQVFNSSAYPFKKRWIEKEAAFFGVTADNQEKKPIDDSLKTHPDCKVRIKNLEHSVQKSAAGKVFVQPQQQFNSLQQQFAFEEVNYCFTSDKVSLSLFNALKLLQQYKENAYLVTMVGKCFNEMYAKQKEHRLNAIVSNPSPYAEKNYNTLLEFISKLTLTELASIGYHYMSSHSNALSANEAFKKAFDICQKNYAAARSN